MAVPPDHLKNPTAAFTEVLGKALRKGNLQGVNILRTKRTQGNINWQTRHARYLRKS